MKVPGEGKVNKSLVDLRKSLKECQARVNQEAGMLLSKGRYARAESLVDVAKSVDTFRTEVESLHTRWKEIKSGSQGVPKMPQTPLWEYYQPILQALSGLGGTSRITEIEPAVDRLLKDRLLEGDLRSMAGGRARWQVMIRRARKHMVKEGLLDSDTGLDWTITQQGRKAAAAKKFPDRG